MWQVVRQSLMKIGWWDASLMLRDSAEAIHMTLTMGGSPCLLPRTLPGRPVPALAAHTQTPFTLLKPISNRLRYKHHPDTPLSHHSPPRRLHHNYMHINSCRTCPIVCKTPFSWQQRRYLILLGYQTRVSAVGACYFNHHATIFRFIKVSKVIISHYHSPGLPLDIFPFPASLYKTFFSVPPHTEIQPNLSTGDQPWEVAHLSFLPPWPSKIPTLDRDPLHQLMA